MGCDGDEDVSAKAFGRILGQEIRRAREAKGWTRLQLVEHLPSGIADRTLLSYEQGIRQLTVLRLVEICRALDVAASDLLDRALVKYGDLRGFALKVNLRAILRNTHDEFEPVRRWAAARLEDAPDAPDTPVLLNPDTVREMAVIFGVTHKVLAAYLARFTIEDLPGA